MATLRSPNYPAIPLDAALRAVEPAYKAEGRNKMARITLAKHLGYTSLNGRALAKIGAVRAYGLIDGSQDEQRVSEDAMICLKAPADSAEGRSALERCATRPALFKAIRSDFPDTLPSTANLEFWLAKNGYTDRAATKAAEAYLATMRLISASGTPEPTAEDDSHLEVTDEPQAPPAPHLANPTQLSPAQLGQLVAAARPVVPEGGEFEWLRGPLSKETSYRIMIAGPIGPREVGKLQKLLEAQRLVLEDDE